MEVKTNPAEQWQPDDRVTLTAKGWDAVEHRKGLSPARAGAFICGLVLLAVLIVVGVREFHDLEPTWRWF